MHLKLSKQLLLSNKVIFPLIIVFLYISLFMGRLPYGIWSSLTISILFPINAWLIAYPTYYFLLPRLSKFGNGKLSIVYLQIYLVLSLLLILVVSFSIRQVMFYLYDVFRLSKAEIVDNFGFISSSLLIYVLCNIGYFREKALKTSILQNKLAIEKKDLEMKVLKSQINTHFLFNALNNIYSMTYFNAKTSSEYVMKLSQMLRYVLEDCEADLVPLSKEIKYMHNYMDFQKARFDTEKDIKFNYKINSTKEIKVPPMIFQPFIENCFKHCALSMSTDYVHIDLMVDEERIIFSAVNTKTPENQINEEEKEGIGIKNLERRLQMNYPRLHTLEITSKDEIYQVELNINLKT